MYAIRVVCEPHIVGAGPEDTQSGLLSLKWERLQTPDHFRTIYIDLRSSGGRIVTVEDVCQHPCGIVCGV